MARRAVLVGWPALLALVLCWPLLTGSGYPLARDLVFVPDQPLTDASLGLSDTAPRAVPLDAVVALLDELVGGAVLARILVPLVLAVAGWGVARLVRDLGTVGRLAASGFAVWNPFVVERLALGQWALIAGYAAIPWALVAAREFRDSGSRRHWAVTTAWVAFGSLTPTGGLLVSAAALVTGSCRRGRTVVLAATCLVLQVPWLAPAFLSTAAGRSDPAGVDAFSAGDEGPGSVVTAVLGLGGIWDAGSVPATREGWWTPVAAVVTVAVLVAGWPILRRTLRGDLPRVATLAGAGFVLAMLSTLPGGRALLEEAVTSFPGAGLLRDSHKFLAPFAILVAAALGATAHRVASAASRRGAELVMAVALLAVPLPLVLLPDAALETWDTVDPVSYPSGFDQVADLLEREDGDLATLPWRSYRYFEWGSGLISSDPAVRWFDRTVLVSDDLAVSRTTIRGESPRGRRLGELLDERPVADALRAEGVGWALVYRDDPELDDLRLDGLEEAYADQHMLLYRVPNPAPSPSVASWRRAVVVGLDLAVLGLVLVAIAVVVRDGFARRRTRRDAAPRLRD